MPPAHVQDNIDLLRKAYDSFLSIFPLCYGYWRRYAEVESRQPDTAQAFNKAVAVYEAAVATIPYCVDAWTYYVQFLLASTMSDANAVRRWV